MPPSPLSHTGKKGKRKGEQDDLHNERTSDLEERRRAVLSIEGMASPDKYARFGQMMADLARSAVPEKRQDIEPYAYATGRRRHVQCINSFLLIVGLCFVLYCTVLVGRT